MKICYIIINKNDFKTTKHLIDNIIDYKIIDTILVMDNASNKDERKLLTSIRNPKIEYLYNSVDKGYSYAINKACDHLIDKYSDCIFIISNSDVVILSENDIERLIEDLNFDCVGLVGPQIIERGKKVLGRHIPTIKQDALKNMGFNVNIGYKDTHYLNDTSCVDVISSAFFLMTSKTYEKINKLDDNVFLYYEDNILAYKMKENNLYTIIDNRVKVKHNFASTIENEIKKNEKMKIFKDSQIYFHTKYSNSKKYELNLLNFSIKLRTFKEKIKK